jgi:hypothetical protein
VGDVNDPAKGKVCNGEPGGVTVCSDDLSVDDDDDDDDDDEEEDEDEDVAEEVDEANTDADNDPGMDDLTVEQESAPGHTSAECPGMANRTCRVCDACTSMSDTQNISDTMEGNSCYLPISSPTFRLPANGDTGVGNVTVDIATRLWDSEYVCRGTIVHM